MFTIEGSEAGLRDSELMLACIKNGVKANTAGEGGDVWEANN